MIFVLNAIAYSYLTYEYKMWATGFMPTPLPNTPGYDVSGMIEAILPAGETDFSVGDAVFGCHW